MTSKIKFYRVFIFSFIFLVFSFEVSAQFRFPDSEQDVDVSSYGGVSTYGTRRGVKQEQTWVAGIVLEAGAQLENVTITMPVPAGWFEQDVKPHRIVKGRGIAPRGLNFRTVNNGAREAVIKFDKLNLNQKLEIILEFDTINYEVEPPANTEIFVIPKRLPNEVAAYLKASPKIEIDDTRVSTMLRKVLREVTNDKQTDWEKVEAIYRYVQKRIKYNDANKSLPAKGVKALLAMPEDKCEGDCKDLCSFFVAMCRLCKVPARLVRLPEHCYAEFYLEVSKDAEALIAKSKKNTEENTNLIANNNENKNTTTPKKNASKPNAKKQIEQRGFWFPCQVAGTYCFGEIHERQVILQKGDAFPDPENQPNGKKQFLTEMFEGSLLQGSPKPKFKFIHDVKTK
ncbi:MAG: transglutaminase-like domain-containing protein [Planctomycetaceae bacterium]|jgi:hypothetical protein|nr:transglutaminase-like domain-containing protein [Planctomycetaceae bacterium]